MVVLQRVDLGNVAIKWTDIEFWNCEKETVEKFSYLLFY